MLSALQRGGFSIVRIRGSHYRLALPQDPSRRVTVPVHKG
ncbi:MAG: type II toxin-antitoxin system HicA family toxin [Thermaerobacter sp.]|nr:type II toxin-antitoxin system HicA family toxin [Thermaerobacter sp.]